MTPSDRPAVRVTDLRGAGSPPAGAVLADPSGRRAVRLHRLGRAVGALFLLWFVCLVLVGLGLLPASRVPLAGTVAPDAQPQSVVRLPPPKPTSRADLRPAAALPGSTTVAPGPGTTTSGTANGQTTPSRAGGGSTESGTSTVTTSPGKSGTAPGQTTTVAPGHSGTAPGQANSNAHSGAGTTTTTTTTPGNSGSAPGQTRTDTTAHGPPG